MINIPIATGLENGQKSINKKFNVSPNKNVTSISEVMIRL